MEILIFGIILSIILLALMSKRSKRMLHLSQLEGYKQENYFKWIKENKDKAYTISGDTGPLKKPLVMTDRAKRLYRCNYILNFAILIIVTMVFIPVFDYYSLIATLIAGLILFYIQPIMIGLSTIIMKPIEERINMGFYFSAQNKIKEREDLKIIGITGSFGKTSTKFIVGTILGEKYNVLNTPESYNTPMGLSKVINNQLNDEHEVFIAEMGAYTIGEIREVAQLAKPQIGVLTSIGPVHMETFKNIDNIMKTKYELIEELPPDGVAIFNYDNEHIKKLADKTFKEMMLYGLEDTEKLDLYADDIEVSEIGSSFTLRDKGGKSIRCNTKLLGKHNIYNLLAGACVGLSLGLSFEEIAKGIEKVEPVEHRLNLIRGESGVIVIDDAFNSNPIGTKAALDVLGQFKEGRKIIVTPGMVELGDMEEEANREFGENVGKVCDYAILIGKKRSKPIYEGLVKSNFNEDNIFVVNSLDEATVQLGKITKAKDVVLFENDLPDNYSE